MSRIDLHLHSTASDGRFCPAEIVRKSAAAGLAVIALADHDTVDGIPAALEAAKSFPGLRVIPGVEVNTDVDKGEIHILGYFINYTDIDLQVALERLRGSRVIRAQKMIAKLKNLGLPIEFERVKGLAGSGSIGRPHLALAMLEKGYITSVKDAFNRYIGWGGPAYVKREKITPAEAVELILKAGGLPVLAHPFTFSDPEGIIFELQKKGLIGIEVYYNNYIAEEVKRLVKLAERYHLLTTGGSDFHGLDITETPIGGVEVPMESAERLITLAGQSLKSANA
ncbi:MAG: PHP domain-containing protein [Chloroflexota bacterium]